MGVDITARVGIGWIVTVEQREEMIEAALANAPEDMYVEDEYRRLGVGTLLIEKFKKYCKEKDIQNIKVTASAKNNRAINFYMKNGFEDYNVTLKMKI